MHFYKQRHKFYCGIDLHARKMYVCILDAGGKTRVHQNIDTDPQLFYDLIFPFLKYDIVVVVECMFSWYWVADLCAEHKIPFALGHALYMRAIHGSKTKDDKKDSYKIAALLKGGNFPIAYPYPAKMRATRDLLRRRTFFVRQCGELVAHIQNTNTQYNLPAFNKKISRKCNRDGVVDRFEQGAVKASVAADLAMIDTYNTVISKLEWQIDKAACQLPEGNADFANDKKPEKPQAGPLLWQPAPSGLLNRQVTRTYCFKSFHEPEYPLSLHPGDTAISIF